MGFHRRRHTRRVLPHLKSPPISGSRMMKRSSASWNKKETRGRGLHKLKYIYSGWASIYPCYGKLGGLCHPEIACAPVPKERHSSNNNNRMTRAVPCRLSLYLEGEPEADDERVVDRPEQLDLLADVLERVLPLARHLVDVLHGEHRLAILPLHEADLGTRWELGMKTRRRVILMARNFGAKVERGKTKLSLARKWEINAMRQEEGRARNLL